MTLARLWWRGFLIVTLTACNVGMISRHHWGGMFVTGGLISVVWWRNVGIAVEKDNRKAQAAYAAGAACGTVFGCWASTLW